jgi:hypothetical protein
VPAQSALFRNAESDYTSFMRVGGILFVLLCLLAPAVFPDTERSPHELYDAIKALRVDSANVYRVIPVNHIQLRRGEAVLSFEEGTLAFFAPLDGQITGAVFSGRGHVLAAPRDPVEKQQMGRFLGAPVLDQEFINGYLRFTDDTAGEFLRQFHAANLTSQTDSSIGAQWDAAVTQLNPSYSLRILVERLSTNPRPCFYAGFEGTSTGPFDVVLDAQRDEPFLLGQVHKGGDSFYDVWTSHRVPGIPAFPVSFRALHYSIETTISPNNSMDATASVRLRTVSGTERVLAFQLSRALTIDSVTGEHGATLAFFQNEGMNLQERSARGNDYLDVVLPQAPPPNQEFTLHFHYRGNVIQNAGNGVLFVGARESWYPHFGDSAEFSDYDLLLRWPHKLRLVATGSKLEEHEEGDFRVGHWKAEKPISVAGFNLGEYASASVAAGTHSIEVYANRELEADLLKRLSARDMEALDLSPRQFGATATGHPVAAPPPPSPSPADALKQLGKEIGSSIRFYEAFAGPFPFHNLSVSQIPGTFGQGWPGLLYVSTYSFLPSEAQQRAGLSTAGQQHYTELVPYHEVAHQWWGNVVAWSSYRDQWIDEAIANYLAVLFADTKKNPDHKLHVWLARYRQQLVEKSPGGSEPAGDIGPLILGLRLNSSKSPSGYEEIVYSKGTWIIHMLREMLRQPDARDPDARFIALLQTLVTKYAYRALSTDDLQHEVEAVMTSGMDLEGGRSMEWFFDEWVRGTGIPHYRVEFTTHHTEKGYLIRGELFQTGVPHSFIASVPLYAGGAGHGVLLGTVVAAGPETKFQFVATVPPHKIVVDSRMTLLCTSE